MLNSEEVGVYVQQFPTTFSESMIIKAKEGVTAVPPADLEGFGNQGTLTWL